MKVTIKLILLLFAVFCLQAKSNAQGLKIPAASSGQTIVQDFGLGKITITYSRPNLNGRKIFGALEPYDMVWRTGANSATMITFSEAVNIEGKQVPEGEYGLFTIPNKKEWTVILSKTSKTWGAYTYDEKDDFVRFKVKPMDLKEKMETFTIQFSDVKTTSAQIHLMWENTDVALNLTTSVDDKVMASIEVAMKEEKKPYFQAAQYYFENGKDLKQALIWMNEAEKSDPKASYIRLWKGRLQLKMDDIDGARISAVVGMNLATEQKNHEYIRLNNKLLEDVKLKEQSKSNTQSVPVIRRNSGTGSAIIRQ